VRGTPRSLSILFLAPQPFFEVRGTPLAVLAMVRALAAAGHRIDLLTFPRGEDASIDRVRHLRSLRLPVGHVRPGFSVSKLLLDVPFIVEAWWRLLLGHYDAVHAVEEAAHLIAPAAWLRGVPLVMDVDSSIPEQLRNRRLPGAGIGARVVQIIEGWALRRATAIITVCASLTEGAQRAAPRVPVVQIEDPPLAGVPSEEDRSKARTLREELGLAAYPVALYSGNFEPYQGVELLIDAVALVPELRVVLMGGEPGEIEVLRRRAREGGCGDRCVFVGKRPPSDLPAYLALADILVSPRCQGKNTPFKVYTYLASGKPLVATRIPTHTQLLDDAVSVLAEPSPAGLAAGMAAVLADPAEAKARAERGLALIERDFGPQRFADKVAQAYATVSS